jgi:hypothetical protein
MRRKFVTLLGIVRMVMGRACSTNWGEEGCIYVTGGRAGRKSRWVDSVRMGWYGSGEGRTFGFHKMLGSS